MHLYSIKILNLYVPNMASVHQNSYRIVSRITVGDFSILFSVGEEEADKSQRTAITWRMFSDHNEIKLKPKAKG